MSPQFATALLLLSTAVSVPEAAAAADYQAENCPVSQGVVESKHAVLDNSHHVVIDGLYVHHTDDEAVHFRRSSADGAIRNSRIDNTGLIQPGFGEGVYIGSANFDWGCHGNSGGMDRSDRIEVTANPIGPNVTAEHLPAGTTVSSSWSSVRTQTGQHYRLTPVSYNGDIAPGQEEDFGFNAAGTGQPLNISVR